MSFILEFDTYPPPQSWEGGNNMDDLLKTPVIVYVFAGPRRELVGSHLDSFTRPLMELTGIHLNILALPMMELTGRNLGEGRFCRPFSPQISFFDCFSLRFQFSNFDS